MVDVVSAVSLAAQPLKRDRIMTADRIKEMNLYSRINTTSFVVIPNAVSVNRNDEKYFQSRNHYLGKSENLCHGQNHI